MSKSSILDPVLRSLAQAYQKQLIKYLAMYNLAKEQKRVIGDNKIEKLEEIIGSRQELIYELDALNMGLHPLKEEIKGALGLDVFSSKAILKAVPTVGAQELDQVLGQLSQVLGTIKELDKENEELLRARLSQVKTDLKEVQSKKQVNKAYSSFGKQQSSKFFDESK